MSDIDHDSLSLSLDAKVLKENKLLTNRQRSIETATSKKSLVLDYEESPESFEQLQYEYKQLALKYEKMEDIAEAQREAIGVCEASNDRMRKYNEFLQGKMMELRGIHGEMVRTVRVSG